MNDESFSATASPSSSNSTFEFYLDGQFASTEAGIIIPTITGGLSFLSSSFIMITIYRSKQNTVYHRILFFLSFWDAIVSFCIALTTLPMPKDVIYDYKGPSYGNHGTCSMQAFLIFLGWGFVVNSNLILMIYYLCAIRYNMSDRTFRRYAERIFLIFSFSTSLISPVYFLSRNHFNPTPVDTFCAVDVYPRECRINENVPCLHGDADTFQKTLEFYYLYPVGGIGIQMLVIISSMIVVVYTVCRPKRQSANDELPRKRKIVIALIGCAYIIACLLSWVFAIVAVVMTETKTIATLKYIFTPLQGWFNLLIFIFHKVFTCTHRITQKSLTSLEIIALLVKSPNLLVDKEVVYNLDIVFEDHQNQRNKNDAEIRNNARKQRSDDPSRSDSPSTSNKSMIEMYDGLGELPLSTNPNQFSCELSCGASDLPSVSIHNERDGCQRSSIYASVVIPGKELSTHSYNSHSQTEEQTRMQSVHRNICNLWGKKNTNSKTLHVLQKGTRSEKISSRDTKKRHGDDGNVYDACGAVNDCDSVLSQDLSIQASSNQDSIECDIDMISRESSQIESVLSNDSTVKTGAASKGRSR